MCALFVGACDLCVRACVCAVYVCVNVQERLLVVRLCLRRHLDPFLLNVHYIWELCLCSVLFVSARALTRSPTKHSQCFTDAFTCACVLFLCALATCACGRACVLRVCVRVDVQERLLVVRLRLHRHFQDALHRDFCRVQHCLPWLIRFLLRRVFWERRRQCKRCE